MFHQHIDFYSNKALLSVKCMKILGNSSHGIIPLQKQLLYRCCILPIALYSFQLQFYKHAPLLYSLKALGKMQRRAAIQVLGVFKTSPTEEIEVIVGLIPIKYHLQKLRGRSQLCATSLPSNHIIQTLMDSPFSSPHYCYLSSLSFFTDQQKAKIKSYLVDSNKRAYRTFPSFSSLHPELSPDIRIIDTFSDCFSFNHSEKKMMTINASSNLTQWLLNHCSCNSQPLSQQMLASRTTLLHPSHICTFQISHSPKLFIMQLLSLVQKQSCSLLDIALTKPLPRKAFPKSQSLLTPFIWLRRSLIPCLILFKFMQQPYLRNYAISFPETQTMQQNFGKAPVISTGIYTKQLIVNQSLQTPHLSIYAKHHGTSPGNLNAMTFFVFRK